MLKKTIILTTFALSSAVFSATSLASEAKLKQFFKEVTSFQANFEQRVLDETGKTLDTKTGVFSFLRPGKFRWNYASTDEYEPIGQQIISDGQLITFYEPDLDTANQRRMSDAISQVPTLLLVQDSTNLETHFTVIDYGKIDGLTWVSLKPRSTDSGYQSLMVGFKQSQLSALVMTDALGNETRLELSDVVTNTALNDDLFVFKPADTTDVVGG